MAAKLENKQKVDLKLVENAIRLAIKKIDAYKNPVIPNYPTEYLIKSVEPMSRFIKDVKSMPNNLFMAS